MENSSAVGNAVAVPVLRGSGRGEVTLELGFCANLADSGVL